MTANPPPIVVIDDPSLRFNEWYNAMKELFESLGRCRREIFEEHKLLVFALFSLERTEAQLLNYYSYLWDAAAFSGKQEDQEGGAGVYLISTQYVITPEYSKRLEREVRNLRVTVECQKRAVAAILENWLNLQFAPPDDSTDHHYRKMMESKTRWWR